MTRRLVQRKKVEVSMEDDLPITTPGLQLTHPKDESLLATKFHWSRSDRPKWLVALLLGCSALYMTRIIMPLCVVSLAQELHWDKKQSGLVLSSFFWGYLITQIPGGFLSDVYGAERLVMWSIIGCSVCTLAVPVVTNPVFIDIVPIISPIALVVIVRVLLGCSQGVFYPSLYSLVGKSLPVNDRSSGSSKASAGGPIGSLVMGSIGSLMLARYGWRVVFIVFGSYGLFWAIVFFKRFVNQNPTVIDINGGIKKEKTTSITKSQKTEVIVPWGKLMREPAIWAVVIVHFCHNCMYFNLISWLPTYFHEKYPDAPGWVFNVLPYVANLIGKIVGGHVADNLIQTGFSVAFVRKSLETVGTSGAALILLSTSYVTGFWHTLFGMSLTLGLSGLTTSGSLCNVQDLSPTFAGSISGIVLSVGAIPGILGVYATGYILYLTNSWTSVFLITFVICVSGNVFYDIVGSGEKIA